MKKKLFALAALVAALGSTAGTASAQDVLTGDTRLACEAILCLSSGTRPSECTPSLSRYFNITKRKLSDTIRARRRKCSRSCRRSRAALAVATRSR